MDSHLRRPPLVVLGLLICTALLWIVPAQATSGAAVADSGLPAHPHAPNDSGSPIDSLVDSVRFAPDSSDIPPPPDTVRYLLPRVEVRASEPPREDPRPDVMTRDQLRRTAATADDVFRAVQTLPGVAGSDFAASFLVRGGGSDETLVRFDGFDLLEPYHIPYWGGAVSVLSPDIVQLHSFDYRNTSQLKAGAVLVVGAGNSGAEIALETSRTHKTWMAGRDVGHVPFHIDGFLARLFLLRVVLRLLFHRILTVATPLGRAARPKVLHVGGPLVRTKPRDLAAAGVERVARVAGVRRGLPVLEDGRVLDVKNIVWCTGFHPGFSWLDLPVFGPNGDPQHERGVVASQPGLYFVGLHFLYAFSSTMIHGVGRDAERIANHTAARARSSEQPMPTAANAA